MTVFLHWMSAGLICLSRTCQRRGRGSISKHCERDYLLISISMKKEKLSVDSHARSLTRWSWCQRCRCYRWFQVVCLRSEKSRQWAVSTPLGLFFIWRLIIKDNNREWWETTLFVYRLNSTLPTKRVWMYRNSIMHFLFAFGSSSTWSTLCVKCNVTHFIPSFIHVHCLPL